MTLILLYHGNHQAYSILFEGNCLPICHVQQASCCVVAHGLRSVIVHPKEETVCLCQSAVLRLVARVTGYPEIYLMNDSKLASSEWASSSECRLDAFCYQTWLAASEILVNHYPVVMRELRS